MKSPKEGSQSTSSSPRTAKARSLSPPENRVFASPRIELPDEHIFPQLGLQEHNERWEHMAEQAGSHKQDGSVLRLNSRMTPEALRNGIPPQAAKRITEIYLPDGGEDLPAWIDAIQHTFFNLEHLYLGSNECTTEEKRVQRLYIIYRLPNLKSIDGSPVTVGEQRLARPNDPNGRQVRRQEWVKDSKPSLLDDDEDGEEFPDDASSSFLSSENMALAGLDILSDAAICPAVDRSFEVHRQLNISEMSDTRSLPLMPDDVEDGEEKKDEEEGAKARAQDESNIEYVEADSVVSCQWGTGCGSLALLRGNMQSGKLRLNFGRKKDEKVAATAPIQSNRAAGIALKPRPQALGLAKKETALSDDILQPSLSTESSDEVHGEIKLAPSTPRNRANSFDFATPKRSPREPLVLRSEKRASPSHNFVSPRTPADFSPTTRISASESLTSPFPMQFRARVTSPGTYGQAAMSGDFLQTISQPIQLARTQSLPATFETRGSGPRHLPPPSPAGPTLSSNVPAIQRRQARWQRKLNARSTSLMDEEFDEGDESDEDELQVSTVES